MNKAVPVYATRTTVVSSFWILEANTLIDTVIITSSILSLWAHIETTCVLVLALDVSIENPCCFSVPRKACVASTVGLLSILYGCLIVP